MSGRQGTLFEQHRARNEHPATTAQSFVMAASRNRLSHPGQQEGIHHYNRLFAWVPTIPPATFRGGAGA